jgi:hypothetical protein
MRATLRIGRTTVKPLLRGGAFLLVHLVGPVEHALEGLRRLLEDDELLLRGGDSITRRAPLVITLGRGGVKLGAELH